MSDTLITVVAIALAAVLMFVFPLMTMSDRTDDVSQLSVETATTEFVDDVRTTGKLSLDKYSKFVENIQATGNSYDVEMEVKTLDENPGKKTTQADATKIGENVYKYYEYIQFKRAYFDCASLDGKGNSGVTYDKDTGRIISMNFVFSGKIE